MNVTRLMKAFLFVLLVQPAFAQIINEAELVKQADARLNDLIKANDAKQAETFYADEFILTTSSGKVKTKQALLTEIASPELSLSVNVTEQIEVRILGATAVLTAVLHQRGSYKGKDFDTKMLVTDTWVKTPEGWKILAGHASVLPKT